MQRRTPVRLFNLLVLDFWLQFIIIIDEPQVCLLADSFGNTGCEFIDYANHVSLMFLVDAYISMVFHGVNAKSVLKSSTADLDVIHLWAHHGVAQCLTMLIKDQSAIKVTGNWRYEPNDYAAFETSHPVAIFEIGVTQQAASERLNTWWMNESDDSLDRQWICIRTILPVSL